MGRKNIYKYSLFYQLLLIIGFVYHRLYFKRFRVAGKGNIPEKTPLIFASNHQNGLMDPLAIIFARIKPVVYFARADIFRKRSIASILYFLKILPIYRPRDGFREVEQNRQMFREAVEIIRHGMPVGILPEGNHMGMKRLRPLHKGAARLALMAEESAGFKMGLKIVPSGIDYSDYFKAGTDLLVVFGEPIAVSSYKELYLENPPKAISQLTENLAEALKKVIIHIGSQEYYDVIYMATEISFRTEQKRNNDPQGLYQEFITRKKISAKLNELFRNDEELAENMRHLVQEYSEKLQAHDLRNNIIREQAHSFISFCIPFLLLATLLPLHVYGMILNYLPYKLPSRISRLAKEKHLKVSVRFGAGLVLFKLWYLLFTLATVFTPFAWYFKLIFLVSLPLSGMFSFYYYRSLLKLGEKWRWHRLKRKNQGEYAIIISLKRIIIDRVIEAMNKMNP